MLAKEEISILYTLLGEMTQKELVILSLRFGLTSGVSWTYREIGKLFGLTPERIRQIELRSGRKIRNRDRASDTAVRWADWARHTRR